MGVWGWGGGLWVRVRSSQRRHIMCGHIRAGGRTGTRRKQTSIFSRVTLLRRRSCRVAQPSIIEQEEEKKTPRKNQEGGRNKVEGGGKKFQMSNSKVCSHWSLVYLLLKPLAPHCCCCSCSCCCSCCCSRSCCCRCPIISTSCVPKCVTD